MCLVVPVLAVFVLAAPVLGVCACSLFVAFVLALVLALVFGFWFLVLVFGFLVSEVLLAFVWCWFLSECSADFVVKCGHFWYVCRWIF